MTAVFQTIPASQISDECISPQFVLELLLSARKNGEASGFVMFLMKQSFERPISLVKEYLGDPKRLDEGTIGEPFLQPVYVQVLGEVLASTLMSVASISTTGLPSRFDLAARPLAFRSSSWWLRDAPALPIASFMLWARNIAWYLYWFAEYSDIFMRHNSAGTNYIPT